MRVTDFNDLDDELLGWLRKSYRMMRMQDALATARAEEPAFY